ncbi:uncharacterized protein EDB91DRAFT_1257442 [Suillus paluster]|uniref:uncharacterized protein n=1 Tax=Suillus paluster TaxID=48578 RepID=UPI001B8672E2|nr:uncharacterized protein EDB91DRAFT_1257442 [Suillus paluster]KAG1719701.1 hypothetical protein EDB91DRAFT_1257442 [Suillus paluster]
MPLYFPLEIIMKILTLATRRRAYAVSWIVLSKRTYRWFETLLYERIVMVDECQAALFIQCLRLRRMHEEFARTSINEMWLGGDIQAMTVNEILSMCTGIRNLALSSYGDEVLQDLSSLQPVLDALPLTVLHLHIGVTLTDSLIANVNVFSRLTHLDIDDHDLLQHVRIESFPQLTHLSLWGDWGDLPRQRPNMVSLIQRLLDHPTMQVIMFRSDDHGSLATFLEIHAFNDPRIIIVPEKLYLWDDLGRGSMLTWEIAEAKVNLPEPNHWLHRCFPPSTVYNGLRQYMNVDSVPRRMVNYRIIRAVVLKPGMKSRNTSRVRLYDSYGRDDCSDDGEEGLAMSGGDSDDGSDE